MYFIVTKLEEKYMKEEGKIGNFIEIKVNTLFTNLFIIVLSCIDHPPYRSSYLINQLQVFMGRLIAQTHYLIICDTEMKSKRLYDICVNEQNDQKIQYSLCFKVKYYEISYLIFFKNKIQLIFCCYQVLLFVYLKQMINVMLRFQKGQIMQDQIILKLNMTLQIYKLIIILHFGVKLMQKVQ
ncbi:hypothetical protein ABPG74_014876 [Tetrahymena malaccensis]